jgi:hypothetical protein
MTSTTTTPSFALVPSVETAWQDVDSSFERFCLTAGIGAIEQMLCDDAQQFAGNAAVVQALIDNLIERGLDTKVCRLFIVDGAKALSKVIRRTFGAHTPIQRCQVHKARNVTERLPKPLHASVRRALRQAWELDDADKAERLLRNLARRLDQEAPGVAASILEGLDEMLIVVRLKLPTPMRRSLAPTSCGSPNFVHLLAPRAGRVVVCHDL